MCGAIWVNAVSKLPTSAQALEQLTISGLARHDQTDLENHLRLRVRIPSHDPPLTVTAADGRWCSDMEQVASLLKPG